MPLRRAARAPRPRSWSRRRPWAPCSWSRLFFVDSRSPAARWLEAHVPPGATVDLIANNPGYAPAVPPGRALRVVPTLSREMAPADRFAEAARALSGRGLALAGPHRLLLRALPRPPRAAAGARRLLPGPARGPGRLRGGGAVPPAGMAAAARRSSWTRRSWSCGRRRPSRPRLVGPDVVAEASSTAPAGVRAGPGARASGRRRRRCPAAAPAPGAGPGRSTSPGSTISARRPAVVAELHPVELPVAGQARARVAHEHAAREGRLVHVLAELDDEARVARARRARRRAGSAKTTTGGTFGRSGGGGGGFASAVALGAVVRPTRSRLQVGDAADGLGHRR